MQLRVAAWSRSPHVFVLRLDPSAGAMWDPLGRLYPHELARSMVSLRV